MAPCLYQFAQVARLFSKLMVEIGYRTEPDIYEDTASDILKQKDPQGYFEQKVDNAIGGVVFIDVSLLHVNFFQHWMDMRLRVVLCSYVY